MFLQVWAATGPATVQLALCNNCTSLCAPSIVRQHELVCSKANELVLRQTRAHVVQLGTMTTHLQTSRDEYRERVRRFEDGWETCIKTMSDIDIPSTSVAGNRPSTVYSDEDEE